MKSKKMRGIFVALIIIIVAGISFFYIHNQRAQQGTTVYTQSELKKILKKKYPDFYQYTRLDEAGQNFIIPNLNHTTTLNKQGVVVSAKDMDPQGLALADNYLLISAYDRHHQNNSVIYVLDKDTRKFIKTIVLKGHPHAGGLAYDAENKDLWITTVNGKKHAQISSIGLDKIENYNVKNTKKPITYKQSINLGTIPEASFVSYHKNSLFIGFFDKKKDGLLARYSVNENGTLDIDKNKTLKVLKQRKLAQPEQTYSLDSKMQGIAFYKDKILLSKSYGPKSSHILVFNAPTNGFDFNLDTKPLKDIPAPPYLEQLASNDETIFSIFESGTAKYRKNTKIVRLNRILELNADKLIQ